MLLSLVGSLPVVFGHIGLVMLICKTGAIPWLTRRLSAVGRMALSNYLFDSLLARPSSTATASTSSPRSTGRCFMSGRVRSGRFHLLVCPLWLEVFRYGPAEWLWRSLTYWKPQKMRHTVA